MNNHFLSRRDHLHDQLDRLSPSIKRAYEAVQRLEREPVPAGATAARAARLSAAQAMLTTLSERERRLQIALRAIDAELSA
ncbi:MAG: hypothetical protein HC822_23975 [Oscillochloris sp.]|nr:hypothetical protein [Oscillochloris sp.]